MVFLLFLKCADHLLDSNGDAVLSLNFETTFEMSFNHDAVVFASHGQSNATSILLFFPPPSFCPIVLRVFAWG